MYDIMLLNNYKRSPPNEKQACYLDSHYPASPARSDLSLHNSRLDYFAREYRRALRRVANTRSRISAFYDLCRNISRDLCRIDLYHIFQKEIERYKLLAHPSHNHNSRAFRRVDLFGENLFIKFSASSVKFYLS